MKVAARTALSPDEIRARLVEMGLHEEEQPIEGFAFTFWKRPGDAVEFFREAQGADPHRFYLHFRSYLLSA